MGKTLRARLSKFIVSNVAISAYFGFLGLTCHLLHLVRGTAVPLTALCEWYLSVGTLDLIAFPVLTVRFVTTKGEWCWKLRQVQPVWILTTKISSSNYLSMLCRKLNTHSTGIASQFTRKLGKTTCKPKVVFCFAVSRMFHQQKDCI